jgi:NADPH:quinone reductase-like Zn-dependent oxidoreductase
VERLHAGLERRRVTRVRAVTYDRYGPPEVMRLSNVEAPRPAENEVLVRVHAATATRTDCGLRSAEYFISRFFIGLFRPKRGRIGIEFAGEIESVGDAVTQFAVGDRVFGIGSGTYAEYVCVSEDGVIARIPDSLTFEEAAGLADGAISALSCLRQAGVGEGTRLVVYGASGSIGVGSVQVAKHLGANVVAVCNTKNVDLMRSLGADEVVDYLAEDFTRNGETYDVVFDAAGKQSFRHCRKSLEPDGLYITTDPGFLWQDAAIGLVSKRAKLGMVRYTKADILTLVELLEAGSYRPVIDRTYALEDVVEAHRYVETHQKTGNVVLRVREPAPGDESTRSAERQDETPT